MNPNKKKSIVIAVTGASGAIYAYRLIKKLHNLHNQISDLSLIISNNGRAIWDEELGVSLPSSSVIKAYENNDFAAPFASGSNPADVLVVIPSSMGIIGRIAGGISNDLITRTADVLLKERKRLIIVPREAPFSLIHIKNLETITLAGGIICPATPSFYHKPTTINSLVDNFNDRIIDLCELDIKSFRWGVTNNK